MWNRNGQTVTFTLLGEESFGYKVTASGDVGSYTFEGVLSNSDRVEMSLGGDAEVSVERTAPTHSASRSFGSGSGRPGGGTDGYHNSLGLRGLRGGGGDPACRIWLHFEQPG